MNKPSFEFKLNDPEGKLLKALRTFKEPIYEIDGKRYKVVMYGNPLAPVEPIVNKITITLHGSTGTKKD